MKKETSQELYRILRNLLKCTIYEQDGSAEHISEYVSPYKVASLLKELAAENEEIANALAEMDLTSYPYSEVSDILS